MGEFRRLEREAQEQGRGLWARWIALDIRQRTAGLGWLL